MDEFELFINKEGFSTPFELTLKPTQRKRKFTDFRSLEKFVEDEVRAWSPYSNENFLETQYRLITRCRDHLKRVRSLYQNNTNSNQCLSELGSAKSALQNMSVFSMTEEGRFILEQGKVNPSLARGASAFLFPENYGGINSEVPLFWKGFYAAATRFSSELEKKAGAMVESFSTAVADLDNEFSDFQQRFSIYCQKLDETANATETENQRILNETTQSFKLLGESFTQWIEEKNQKMADLEHLYEETLKIDAPAKYWARLIEKYTWSGVIWAIVSAVLVVGGSIAGFLSLPTVQSVLMQAGADWQKALPVTVLTGVIVSVWVYAVRTTIRLTLSGFHLVRDATERKHLSHYYLSLMKRGKIDEKEAQTVILQSLFSRAETGLLKGDSSPAMPGSMAEILKNLKG